MKKNRKGKLLIAASLLTLVWLLLCPKYTEESIRGVSKSILKEDKHYYESNFVNLSYFFPGILVIYLGLAGAYILIQDPTNLPKKKND